MTEAVHNAVSWFDIPVFDLDRAAAFYNEILGVTLGRYGGALRRGVTAGHYGGPGLEGALFPVPGVSGTLIRGDGFTPGHGGSVVYLNAGGDLNTVLNRVAGAGGKVLLEKAERAATGAFSPTSKTPRATASGCIRSLNGHVQVYFRDVGNERHQTLLGGRVRQRRGPGRRLLREHAPGSRSAPTSRWTTRGTAGSRSRRPVRAFRSSGRTVPATGRARADRQLRRPHPQRRRHGEHARKPEGSPWGVFAELRDPDGNAFVLHRAPGA